MPKKVGTVVARPLWPAGRGRRSLAAPAQARTALAQRRAASGARSAAQASPAAVEGEGPPPALDVH
eukprot:10379446-Alexandrium_andersonii.AAC.1